MEPFLVSARKYRPKTFKDVVGQKAITDTLENAIEKNHLASALLFCGPRGVGKTTCARILAKKINETEFTDAQEDFAFNIFELDAASNNSVEDIRSLIDQVRIPPQQGKFKVYIIDEVHMLSSAAFNAFLKTLEEPPKHAIFILATTEKHKIIPTILSRCQIFDFKRIGVNDAVDYLQYIAQQQGITAEEDALHIIAQKADGAMRDALSIFDRIVSFCGSELTKESVKDNLNVLDYETYIQITDLILEGDIPSLMLLYNEILNNGFDGHHFIIGLASHFRDLMICQYQNATSILEISQKGKIQYQEQANKTHPHFLLEAIQLANECDLNFKISKNQRLLVELTLMKLASLAVEGEKKKLIPKVKILPTALFKEQGYTAVEFTPKASQTDSVSIIQPDSELELQTDSETGSITDSKTDAKPILQSDSPIEVIHPTALEEDVHNPEESTLTPEETIQTSEESPLIAEVSVQIMQEPIQTTEEAPLDEEVKAVTQEKPRPKINIAPKGVSAYSISSIHAKKEIEERQKANVPDTEILPEDVFEEAQMQLHWNEYVSQIDREGKKILASNLASDTPKLLKNNTLWIELPNDTMKKEIERSQSDLLNYLKEKLNNYSIQLRITVSEEVAKQYAFTPEEKYEKLKSKNPHIESLRVKLDLDLS